MPEHRRSTIRPTHAKANELSKSIELEQRVARVELELDELRQILTALQAQLDHLSARVRAY